MIPPPFVVRVPTPGQLHVAQVAIAPQQDGPHGRGAVAVSVGAGGGHARVVLTATQVQDLLRCVTDAAAWSVNAATEGTP